MGSRGKCIVALCRDVVFVDYLLLTELSVDWSQNLVFIIINEKEC